MNKNYVFKMNGYASKFYATFTRETLLVAHSMLAWRKEPFKNCYPLKESIFLTQGQTFPLRDDPN